MSLSARKPYGVLCIVDDDPDMRDSLADLLNDHGYTTEAHSTGADALVAIEHRKPEVLITDLVMNGMQGLELLRAAKQRDPNLAVVVITAFGTIESAVEAMRMGAFYYLTKPFNSADLLLLI